MSGCIGPVILSAANFQNASGTVSADSEIFTAHCGVSGRVERGAVFCDQRAFKIPAKKNKSCLCLANVLHCLCLCRGIPAAFFPKIIYLFGKSRSIRIISA
jgi:hypothetical protein